MPRGSRRLIYDMVHVNVNVTDVAHSIPFYETLGFRVIHTFGEEGATHGASRTRGVVMSLGDHPRCFTKLELIEFGG
jgi:predicted lactoylglutathione lyase